LERAIFTAETDEFDVCQSHGRQMEMAHTALRQKRHPTTDDDRNPPGQTQLDGVSRRPNQDSGSQPS
ncbi:hypothetical protein AB4144_14320, partial [Rhizobiaceae sp. 2RAB30]